MILALDTATPATVVGVAATDGTLLAAHRHDPGAGEKPGHTTQLLPLAHAALTEAGATWSDLTRIGAGVGPGTFTGIRIGVATARALAQGLDIETVALSTLHALALGAVERRLMVADGPSVVPRPGAQGGGPVLAILDARRGEAYVAAYDSAGAQLLAPSAWAPERLAEVPALAPGSWQAVGDGAVRFRAELEAVGVAVSADGADRHKVSAGPLCRLAAEAPPVPRDALVPEYVRAPDAVPRR
ncbi:tRNA (adenosine(37)-N6)-threonylcarbamoyltransferase complex dimerization subunit type 1 TsaB [Baekduia sp.]|jgi:tRNA threonylcarbamoyladenosine biosynthesis protein TsaB|uniref:tRNA (adenosine(37)-N6)-threonylcarbamoyltransferase complex dimerization subunit type 1 TsaB n=1 Tax=Baekduia sp. TaxID=2600305 RepID=UPI002DFC498E|nr:tRNA (adenosine(37)-N6)-threonylcarbamoyltransferase complex dimerization subunit type 1 TsaB [Baekduia sp.]